MPTVNHERTHLTTSSAFVATWPNLGQGDDGQHIQFAQYTDRSAQVFGIFGGASIAVQGSNDGANWATLTDPQGNDLLLTSAKIEMITEATAYIRPLVVGGDGTTDLTVCMLCKESR